MSLNPDYSKLVSLSIEGWHFKSSFRLLRRYLRMHLDFPVGRFLDFLSQKNMFALRISYPGSNSSDQTILAGALEWKCDKCRQLKWDTFKSIKKNIALFVLQSSLTIITTWQLYNCITPAFKITIHAWIKYGIFVTWLQLRTRRNHFAFTEHRHAALIVFAERFKWHWCRFYFTTKN